MSGVVIPGDLERSEGSLRVGVTANRWRMPGEADNMRLNPAHRDTLETTLRHVMTQINRAVETRYNHDAPRRSNAKPVPTIRLISPLAEGGDRVAATVAISLDKPWELFVITPEDISQLPDRDPHIPLSPLWAAAKVRILLDGKQLDDDSLLEVNRQLLQHSDLLISLWDKQPARGAAGTENVINQALDAGIPVIIIDAEPLPVAANTPHAFRVITPDRKPSNDNDDNALRDIVTLVTGHVG